jgi:hypothetical protein
MLPRARHFGIFAGCLFFDRFERSQGGVCMSVLVKNAAICLMSLGMTISIASFGKQAAFAADSPSKYTLRYRFEPSETIRYEVTHVAKTKTRLRGTEEVSQVHTVSEKVWEFQAPDSPGKMTFDHSVGRVEMMQQTGDKPEIRWSSESGSEPPVEFEKVAEQLGKTLSTVTINGRGQETDRKTHAGSEAQLGMGGLTIALPEEAIAIGGSWGVPREVKVRTTEGEVKVMKVREMYTLEKVETGIATLSIRSEVLTPIEDETIKGQLVQQLSNGSVRFDLDDGRVLSKQLDWDETVVGFQGANSLMEYRARLTETMVTGPVRTAKK